MGRGALLGPEESGLLLSQGRGWTGFSRVTVTLVWSGVVVAGAGSHQTVGVGVCSGCVVSLGWVLVAGR
jgi:hypothetical protein